MYHKVLTVTSAFSLLFTSEILGCLDSILPSQPILSTSELVRSSGFQSEEHFVKTRDGYILTIFRIKPQRNKNSTIFDSIFNDINNNFGAPVLMMPGMFCSSDIFIFEPNSLGIQLAKEGFDVWIGNFRGNVYSRKHVVWSPADREFWNFSFHEMGTFDLPAITDYVLRKTRHYQLHYVGHSMATSAFLAMGATKTKYNAKFRTAVLLAPVARVTKHFAIFNSSMFNDRLTELLDDYEVKGKVEVFPRRDISGTTSTQIDCKDLMPLTEICCINRKFFENLTKDSMPAGTSLKTNRHFFQIVAAGRFQNFDYGDDTLNMKMWGQRKPPEYDLRKVTAPVAIFYTPSEIMSTDQDEEYLITILPNMIKVWKAPDFGFSHGDFVVEFSPFSKAARQNMTAELVAVLKMRNLPVIFD